MKKYDLKIEGMTCASCVTRVEKIIGKFEQVKNVSVNLAMERVHFETDNEMVNIYEIADAVKEYGYKIKIDNLTSQNENPLDNIKQAESDQYYISLKKEFYFAIILALPIFLISMLFDFQFFHLIWPFTEDDTRKILLILTTPIMFISGKRFFIIFWNNLKHLYAEMNSLVAIGTGSAYLYSALVTLFPHFFSYNNSKTHVYFETAAVIITLILMGKIFEHRAKNKTSEAIKKLIQLKPKTAIILENEKEVEINITELKINDVVIIKPGGKIPADGIIVSGESSIDESMITGESLPVEKNIGEKIIGGTINKNGTFNFRVTQIGDNSVLGQIIRLVEHALAAKPPIQKLVDKIAGIFVPIVILLALSTFIGWFIFSPEHSFNNALVNFVAVLIIACPCALGLATPTAIIVGTGLGASNGILIRNGESLELANKISTVVFDKTGTITEGKPCVSGIYTTAIDKNQLLKYAASLESKSEHPIANAIIEKARSEKIELEKPDSFFNKSGYGIVGIVANKNIIAGNMKLMLDQKVKIEGMLENYNELLEKNGTVICVAIDEVLQGLITIEDKIKPTSIEAITKLHSMNIKTVMLTGDNKKSAESIAKKIGINEFEAEILPENKLRIIKKIQSNGETVAMVGDGINDAPALAQANIGIAIGTGTDVAIESAQITLVKGSLLGVVKAINLSSNTLKTIKQNLFWAFVYNTVLIPLAAFGILNPMIAALAMSLSSVSVVTNSLRLKRAKLF
jgi:Cu+-exporting ATPase